MWREIKFNADRVARRAITLPIRTTEGYFRGLISLQLFRALENLGQDYIRINGEGSNMGVFLAGMCFIFFFFLSMKFIFSCNFSAKKI
ncbi:hypothetical protein GIB67_042705 [Kingdonia uniflora]|uniref:Uncharacterized protein n=1 Tax=Kingdonia uniflora TaxID=39325 RepID=A0A7J7NDH3_9MAGN|nr:hypothetical protein GIB67_042705 [Kingdonia uniflora]